jgi:hypothetical protein
MEDETQRVIESRFCSRPGAWRLGVENLRSEYHGQWFDVAAELVAATFRGEEATPVSLWRATGVASPRISEKLTAMKGKVAQLFPSEVP